MSAVEQQQRQRKKYRTMSTTQPAGTSDEAQKDLYNRNVKTLRTRLRDMMVMTRFAGVDAIGKPNYHCELIETLCGKGPLTSMTFVYTSYALTDVTRDTLRTRYNNRVRFVDYAEHYDQIVGDVRPDDATKDLFRVHTRKRIAAAMAAAPSNVEEPPPPPAKKAVVVHRDATGDDDVTVFYELPPMSEELRCIARDYITSSRRPKAGGNRLHMLSMLALRSPETRVQ